MLSTLRVYRRLRIVVGMPGIFVRLQGSSSLKLVFSASHLQPRSEWIYRPGGLRPETFPCSCVSVTYLRVLRWFVVNIHCAFVYKHCWKRTFANFLCCWAPNISTFSVKAQYVMGKTGAQKQKRKQMTNHLRFYLSESSAKVVKGMPRELTGE